MYRRKPEGSFKLLFFACCAGILLTACKKDKSGQQEELPVLGTCQVVAPIAGFQVQEDGLYEYNSGKGTIIRIDTRIIDNVRRSTVTITYSGKYTYQLWGDSQIAAGSALHENLNGKHIKDRIGKSRSVITPDGTKITLVSTGPQDPVTAFTIYHDANVYHVNVTCNKLEYNASNQQITGRLDELQADGETSMFEDTETSILFYNIYNEDTPGNKVYQRIDLGSIPKNNLNQVNDLYDDPRLGHT